MRLLEELLNQDRYLGGPPKVYMDKCEKCGHEKDMYYVPWCPRCEKPKKTKVSVLNFKQCLRHIEVITGDNKFKNRIWTELCNDNKIHNDTCFMWYPTEETEESLAEFIKDPKVLEKCRQGLRDDILLAKTFNITDKGILFEVSW